MMSKLLFKIKEIFREKMKLCELFYVILPLSIFFGLIFGGIFVILSSMYHRGSSPDANNSHQFDMPYMAFEEEYLLKLITKTHLNCSKSEFFEGTNVTMKKDTKIGHEGTWICHDFMPKEMTPSNCKIYSFDFNRYDVKFERKMSMRDCRVHLISSGTEFNYAEIRKNFYMYPLKLSRYPGKAEYTLDDYIDLLSHHKDIISYVKATTDASAKMLLENLYTSEFKYYKHIKQLRLIVNVPTLDGSDEAAEEVKSVYQNLRGLDYIGFKLIHSRPISEYQYYHINLHEDLSTKYELVYVRP